MIVSGTVLLWYVLYFIGLYCTIPLNVRLGGYHTIWGCSIAHEKHEGEKKAKRKKEDKDEDEDGRQKMEGRLNTEGMGLSQSF